MKYILLLTILLSVSFSYKDCKVITRSSFINQVCYDTETKELWMLLDDKWYKYNAVPVYVYEHLIIAPSMGQFFDYNIRNHFSFTREAP